MLDSSKKVIGSVVELKTNLAEAVDSSSDVELNLDNVAVVVDSLSAEVTSVNEKLTSVSVELETTKSTLVTKNGEFEQLQEVVKKDLTNKCTWLGDDITLKKVEVLCDPANTGFKIEDLLELKIDVDKMFNEKFDLTKKLAEDNSGSDGIDTSKFNI